MGRSLKGNGGAEGMAHSHPNGAAWLSRGYARQQFWGVGSMDPCLHLEVAQANDTV